MTEEYIKQLEAQAEAELQALTEQAKYDPS
jgi:hypothetical protein